MKPLAIVAFAVFADICCLSSCSNLLVADEPAEEFLEQLRDKGYYDIAFDYLEEMKTSNVVNADFKIRIPFEQADTLIKSNSSTRDLRKFEDNLVRAEKLLTDFASSNAPPELASQAERTRASAIYSRAKLCMMRSESDRVTEKEKRELVAESRKRLEEANQVFERNRSQLGQRIKDFKIDPQDSDSRKKRERLRSEYVSIRLMSPMIKEQIGDTYESGAPERKAMFEKAADEYSELARTYYRYPAGIAANLYAGRCFTKLARYDDAIPSLLTVLDQGNSGILRNYKRDAALIAIECWEAKKAYNDIIQRLKPMIESISKRESRQSAWLKIQLAYAKACRAKAALIEADKNKTKKIEYKREIRDLNRDAVSYLRIVAKSNGEYREIAQKLLAEWNLNIPKADAVNTEPRSLAEARDRARDILSETESDRMNIAEMAKQIKAKGGDPDLETNLNSARTAYEIQIRNALELLHTAISLAEPDTSREDINNVRYLQTVAHFSIREYFESALIGEFLIDRYRNVPGTREAANLVLESYVQLYQNAAENDKAFELERLTNICSRIIEYWPNEASTERAITIFVKLKLQEKDLDRAVQLLSLLADDAVSRPDLEIKVGRSIWNDYLIDKRTLEEAGKQPDEKLKKSVELAHRYLTHSVSMILESEITRESASAALALAQIHLERGDFMEAVAQLESAGVAPLDLIKQKHPSAADPRFVRDTYKTAMRGYIAAMQNSEDSRKWVSKAQGVVGALKQSLEAQDPKTAGKRMVAVYYRLARELIEQLDEIDEAEEKKAFADSLASFLKTVQLESSDAKIQLWAGSTLSKVAESLEPGTDQTRRLYQQSVNALDSANRIGFAGDKQAAIYASDVARRRAIAYRGLGDFEKAANLFIEQLRKKNGVVTIQIEAARTFQMWGVQKKISSNLIKAVSGAQLEQIDGKRPANVVWGWKKLTIVTRNDEKFRDNYFEAIYNLCLSRFEYGQIENREDAKESALQGIVVCTESYPDLDGKWLEKFDELARKIQQSTGKSVKGIK